VITFLALVAVVQAFMALCLATASYSASHEALVAVRRNLQMSVKDLEWANLMDTVKVGRDDIDMLRSKRNHPASGNF
jgi:predicted lysophospholipase L1 biosynthesis ABC-type transport system permease subunit